MSEPASARLAKEQLKAFIERVERLEEEKKAMADDIRDVYAEAKAHGFDTRAMRTIVKKRKLDQEERRNQERLVETYMVALGMGWGKAREERQGVDGIMSSPAMDGRERPDGIAREDGRERPDGIAREDGRERPDGSPPRAASARSRASALRSACVARSGRFTASPGDRVVEPHTDRAGDTPPRPGAHSPGGAAQRAPPPRKVP